MGKNDRTEREASQKVVVHPHVAARIKEIDALRERLSVLIEEQESLLYGQRDALLATYNRDIGYLEHECFLLDVSISELRKRIAILQANVNRGLTVTDERIIQLNEEIRIEFEKFYSEIRQKERELRQSAQLLEHSISMKPEDALEMKTLYRRICQRYHPDVGGGEAENWEQIWSTLQHAYRAGDLELLRALAESLELAGKPVSQVSGDLDAEIQRLRVLIERQRARIGEILSEPPFSFREELQDPRWIEMKQTELGQKIVDRENLLKKLEERYDLLLPLRGPAH